MKRLKVLSLLLGFLVSNTAFGQYLLTYEQQIEGATGYNFIDPVISTTFQLDGFVYCDTISNTVRISLMDRDSTIVWQLSDPPHRTINYVSKTSDSLIIYVLHGRPYDTPNIGRLILSGDSLTFDDRWTRIYVGSGGFITSSVFGLHFMKSNNVISGVVMESLFRVEGFDFTQGPWGDNDSRTIVYSLDLSTEIDRQIVSAKKHGNLLGDSTLERATIIDVYHFWDFSDQGISNQGLVRASNIAVADSTGSVIISRTTDGGETSAFFVDRFDSNSGYDQLIFYGIAGDLLGQRSAIEWHVARYDFSSGIPREVWYQPLSGVSLDYVFNAQHVISGLRNKNQLVALNYMNGSLADLSYLDRTLSDVRFFETGTAPPLLGLVGRVTDTIFVYQFDTPTDVAGETETSTLPSSFVLHQNHPNPFNGATIIQFTNQQRQRLTLTVFNLLGQPVATLLDRELPAGEYNISWNPTLSRGIAQATGVYFARLNSVRYSRVIKMTYLK